MSDSTAHWSLPPLFLYPERRDSGGSWSDRLEASLTAAPMMIWPRLRPVRTARLVQRVNLHEPLLRTMHERALQERVTAVRAALRRRGFCDASVGESFAVIREFARRRIGLRHYDVQLRGGFTLLQGMVAEMETGEGKTLTATLAAGTAALAGIPVHLVTVNDYLAQRDADNMGPVYRALGLSVGTVVHGMQPEQRRAAYAAHIVYASNKEITFDYLRDRIALGRPPSNLALKLQRLQSQGARVGKDRPVVMRGLHFAIVDEADSVLVDEARTPLIISRQTDAKDERRWAEEAFKMADQLEAGRDFRILKDERRIELTQGGRQRLSEMGEARGGIWRSRIRREESARQALTARNLFVRGDHYLVRDGKIQIVDEYTGRIMADRSWSEGLHQLVEVKEGCDVTSRNLPIARMTYQRFFRRYRRLAGMTGTASEVSAELWHVYRLPVLRIPTNRPLRRRRLPIGVCRTADEKWQRVVERSAELSRRGRPVLIGTRSVTASETVSEWLTRSGLEHMVLNATQDEAEAEVIATAGGPGRITVATNMAGRGVDICLGDGIAALGGLHVLLTERHDARRIDRQLEGRCGRQGDPGSTEAILSLEDPLLELLRWPWLIYFARIPGPVGRLFGVGVFRAAQIRAEGSHARARRDLAKRDRKLGELLAFSGGIE